jgi:prolyl oligopeptidase
MVDAVDRLSARYPAVTLGYPSAERLDIVDDLHGRRVADPYRWLEDPRDPRVEAWSAAQDGLLAAHRATWDIREPLRERLAELLAVGTVSAPQLRAGRAFFPRREPDHEHAVLLVREADGRERALVDPVAVDPTGATTLDFWYPSPDGTRLAYGLSTGGTEDSALRLIDVASGDLIEGPIDRVRYANVAWLPGGEAYYYTRYLAEVPGDDPVLHRRVYLHQVGADPAEDVLIFGVGAPRGRYFWTDVSTDGRWLTVIGRQGTDPRNDVWVADLAASRPETPALRVLQEGVDAMTVPVFRGDRVYLWTDRDAPHRRLCVASPENLSYEAWQDLIPEDPDSVLGDYAVLDGAELDRPVLLVTRTRHAVSELASHDLASGELIGAIDLPRRDSDPAGSSLGSVGSLSADPAGGSQAWFDYSDFTTPNTVYRYDARDQSSAEWARPPGAASAPDVTARQVSYQSKDGTTVRMFVLAPTDAQSGPHPALLWGYGGFNIALAPEYSAMALCWVRAGGVYAVANLRGGSEEGEQWHRDGMLAHKQNVFDDFHAAAEYLIDTGVSAPDRLAIMGGSNGGLLIGAALTQRPDLYATAVCSAPLLDMVRYELFGLGTTWSGEYGTAGDPEQLDWLLGYSPYHHVRDGVDYPAVLFTVFDGDSRVDPMHARKLAAALQHATDSGRPILLRRERDVGHAGRSVSRAVELWADKLAFLAVGTGLA